MPEDKRLVELDARLNQLEAALQHRFPILFDPAPDDWGHWGGWPGRRIPIPFPMPHPHPGDPVPIDVSRLTKAQLMVSLEVIKAQRIRLDAMEKMINDQIKKMR